jgi:hypothetical protein
MRAAGFAAVDRHHWLAQRASLLQVPPPHRRPQRRAPASSSIPGGCAGDSDRSAPASPRRPPTRAAVPRRARETRRPARAGARRRFQTASQAARPRRPAAPSAGPSYCAAREARRICTLTDVAGRPTDAGDELENRIGEARRDVVPFPPLLEGIELVDLPPGERTCGDQHALTQGRWFTITWWWSLDPSHTTTAACRFRRDANFARISAPDDGRTANDRTRVRRCGGARRDRRRSRRYGMPPATGRYQHPSPSPLNHSCPVPQRRNSRSYVGSRSHVQ